MKVLIFGGGGHTKQVIDTIRQLHNWHIEGVVSDKVQVGEYVERIKVIGTSADLPELKSSRTRFIVNGVGGGESARIREQVYHDLRAMGFMFPSFWHPTATISPSVEMGEGVQVFANTIIGPACSIGNNVLINNGVILSHDCTVDDNAHLTPGAIIAGGCHIGKTALIGMGATVFMNVKIGEYSIVHNGVNVYNDVPSNWMVKGRS